MQSILDSHIRTISSSGNATITLRCLWSSSLICICSFELCDGTDDVWLQMLEIIRSNETATHWPTVEAALFVMSSVARHVDVYVDYVMLRYLLVRFPIAAHSSGSHLSAAIFCSTLTSRFFCSVLCGTRDLLGIERKLEHFCCYKAVCLDSLLLHYEINDYLPYLTSDLMLAWVSS